MLLVRGVRVGPATGGSRRLGEVVGAEGAVSWRGEGVRAVGAAATAVSVGGGQPWKRSEARC